MPRYDYICRGCGHGWEATQRIAERHTAKCPNCGKVGKITFKKAPALVWSQAVADSGRPSHKK